MGGSPSTTSAHHCQRFDVFGRKAGGGRDRGVTGVSVCCTISKEISRVKLKQHKALLINRKHSENQLEKRGIGGAMVVQRWLKNGRRDWSSPAKSITSKARYHLTSADDLTNRRAGFITY